MQGLSSLTFFNKVQFIKNPPKPHVLAWGVCQETVFKLTDKILCGILKHY